MAVAAPPRTARGMEALKAARVSEEYVLTARRTRHETFQTWKQRIDELDHLYAGDFTTIYPDETARQEAAKVMNLIQVGIDDMAKLSTETFPQTKVAPRGDDDAAVLNASTRACAFDTFWIENNGPDYVDSIASYDLIATGGSFVAVSVDSTSEYPVYTRLDPRGCYPDVVNGKLIDLLVVGRYKTRHAEEVFGFNMGELFGPSQTGEVEILDYYSKHEVVRYVALVNGAGQTGNLKLLDVWTHELGVVPVAWSKMPTLDNAWRGAFDQVKGILVAQHRIVQLVLDYSEQMVYSPFVMFDVENDDEPPGPRTVYRLRSEQGKVGRVSPAGSQPELFNILEFLDRQGRGGAGWPAQRQGVVNQSIASASFVSSTLGQLVTQVKAIQSQKATLRKRLNSIASRVDCKYLDHEKPLHMPVRDQITYSPVKLFEGHYDSQAVYGAGAGLDAINKKFAVQQDLAGRLISKRTAREQTDYIDNQEAESRQIDFEDVQEVVKQKVLATEDPVALAQVLILMNKGMTFVEALEHVIPDFEQRAAQASGQIGAPPEAQPPTEPGAPGAQQPQATTPVQLPGPPQESVLVTPPRWE